MARPEPTKVVQSTDIDGIVGYGLAVHGRNYLHFYLVGYVLDGTNYIPTPRTATLRGSNGLFLRLVHGRE